MNTPQEPPPVIAGYTIRRPLAEGGMGSVFEAVHDTLDRRVAIKVVQERYAREPDFAERFLREARTAARISHPGVITVHDAGRDQTGRLYLVMGYVEGGDLAGWVREPSPLDEADVLRIGIRCAQALAVIHGEGLIHRDIKPENILMTPQGEPVITDLGLARNQAGDDRMTATGQILGTPAYMSPEQATGAADIDHRSDIYSLGASLFALLAGRPPFRGDTPWATVAAIIDHQAPDLRRFRPQAHSATADLLARCLAKRPDDRPASADELVLRLEACVAAVTAGRSSTAATMIAAEPGASEHHAPTHRTRLVATALGLAAVVIALGALGAIIAVTDEGEITTVAMSPDDAPASSGESARSEGPSTVADTVTTAEQAETSETSEGRDPVDAAQASIKSNILSSWSQATGALSEPVVGSVDSLEPALRAELLRLGATVTQHEIDDGIAEIEGEIEGEAYRVSLHPIDDRRVRLMIESGFPRDAERQRRVRALLDRVLVSP